MKLDFIKLDLSTGNKVFEIKLYEKFNRDLILPTSIALINDFFYISLGSGTIVKIDNNGNKYWERNFNDLLKNTSKRLLMIIY